MHVRESWPPCNLTSALTPPLKLLLKGWAIDVQGPPAGVTARDQVLADLACLFNGLLRPVPSSEAIPSPPSTSHPDPASTSAPQASSLQPLPSHTSGVHAAVLDVKQVAGPAGVHETKRIRGSPQGAAVPRTPPKARGPALNLSLYAAAVQALRDAKHFVKDYGGELRPDKLPASCCTGIIGAFPSLDQSDHTDLHWACQHAMRVLLLIRAPHCSRMPRAAPAIHNLNLLAALPMPACFPTAWLDAFHCCSVHPARVLAVSVVRGSMHGYSKALLA